MNKKFKDFASKKNLIKTSNHSNELIVITGGNSGIGFEFIRMCLLDKYCILFTVRSKEKGEATINKLKEEFPDANINYKLLDVSDIDSINHFVDEIKNEEIDVHHFYHNAGILKAPFSLTKQNLEINMATNYFGPYLLTKKLIPYFNSLSHQVHINFIFSATTRLYKIDYSNFNPDHQTKKMALYAQSKLAIVHMYYHFLEEYKEKNIRFTLTHPGAAYTPIVYKGYNKASWFQFLAKVFMNIFFNKPYISAYTYKLALKDIDTKEYYIAPRGLGNLKGYPKYKTITKKQIQNYEKTIQYTEDLLNKYY